MQDVSSVDRRRLREKCTVGISVARNRTPHVVTADGALAVVAVVATQ